MNRRGVGSCGRAEVRTALRVVIVGAVMWFVVQAVSGHWDTVRASAAAIRPDWFGVLGASILVIAGYAVLIAAWRRLLEIWGSPLPLTAATRIWFVSSLGKYIPGKLWSIGAMAVLAKDAGASPLAATGSAIIMQLVNIAAGFVVVAAAGAGDFIDTYPGLRLGAVVAIVLCVLGLIAGPQLLIWTVGHATRLFRRPMPELPPITRVALLFIFGANVLAWIAYGAAFGLFWTAILGRGGGISLAALAVYTASYLLGFLALVVPGGLGVRESALIGLLVALRLATPSDAALLAASSRIWLTVLEILPGLAFLPGVSLRRRTPKTTPDGPAA